MHQLILIDKTSGLEVGRRQTDREEFYDLCRGLQSALLRREPMLLSHDTKDYQMHTAAWIIPEQDCVVSVTCYAKARMSCGCEMGSCSCC